MKAIPKIFIHVVPLLLLLTQLQAQNLDYARTIIERLASENMHGRGYVNGGDSIAADFIAEEMALAGLRPFGPSYFQPFTMSVNSLPGKLDLTVDGKKLKPCDDFLVYTPSAAVGGQFRTVCIDSLTSPAKRAKLVRKGLKNKVLVVYPPSTASTDKADFDNYKWYNTCGAEAVITVTPKKGPLTWSVYTGHLLLDFASIEVSAAALPKKPRKVNLNVENKYLKNHTARNVAAYVEGSLYPDSFIVFTAHYDHLGRMGEATMFPGAHDNASGVAMMLDLAAYYSENPPPFSIAFIATAAEEAGLLGAMHYAANPLFPLPQIKFLINLDMVTTGEEGMMVVNGSVFTEEFEILTGINNEMKYMADIKSRGEAANSDHYPFYRKGVKSFYFYTLGGYSQYHNPNDIPATLPMYAYNNMFRLIVRFVEKLTLKEN